MPGIYKVLSLSDLRLETSPDPDDIYYVTDHGQQGEWYFDPLDTTSIDNTGTVVQSSANRFKRVLVDVLINVKWFGAKGDQIADDTAAIQAAFDFTRTENKGYTILFPIGNYKITATIDHTCPVESSPRIIGESKGRGNLGSTILWYGSMSGTMFKLRRMHSTEIANLDFTGNNGTGDHVYPKYILHFEVDGDLSLFSSFVHIHDCSFSAVAGTGSASLNLNGSGAFTNYQCSEISIEHCSLSGNGFNIPPGRQSEYSIIVGGFNTKDFYIKNCYATGFSKAFFKSVGDAGSVHSADNILSTNEWNFDINNGTQLTSINDYTESSGGLLKAGGGATITNVQLINYSWFCNNYDGANPNYPTTKEFIIEGQGNLVIQSGAFMSNDINVPKINWTTDNGMFTMTAMNATFSGVKEGITPFYSSGNPVLIQDREIAYGQYIQHRVTALNIVGAFGGLYQTSRFPNGSTDDMLIRGLHRYSAAIGRPVGATNQPKRWYENDVSIEFNTPDRTDSRSKIKYYRCVQQGTFKTINVTATFTTGSLVASGVSDINKIEPGDIIQMPGAFGGSSYRFSVASVNYPANSFTFNPYPSGVSGIIAINNAVPVFQACGGAYGTSSSQPTLGVDDVGFTYFNVTTNQMEVWDGSVWINVSGFLPQIINSPYISNTQSSNYTGAADGEAKLSDLNNLRIAYENLRLMTEDLRTKLIASGIVTL